MADGGVSWPSELELKLNLNAIKKCDQFVVNIIDSASQVALYKFKSETQAWEKTDVEGALFVYIRSSYPKYSFFIMNRLNMNNIMEPITKEMEFKHQDPFLLFRNKTSGIFGIWFYDGQECARLSKLLTRLSLEEPVPARRPTSNPDLNAKALTPQQPKPKGQVDILSMLTSAQKQFEKRNTDQATPLEQKPALESQKQQFLQQNQDQLDQLKQLMRGSEQTKTKQRAYSSPAPYKPPSNVGSTSAPFPLISENGLSERQFPLENQRNKDSPKSQILPLGHMFASPDRPVQRKVCRILND
ncbi:hypothetical protein QZH41_015438 [Actinostola sp. cb2023]|nr:hypothetical protein QZH41_015438 [Actinostola sp. cb2023]